MGLLELEDIAKSYGSHRVLDGVSLQVNEHQITCLIGASGSGKSTLLRCLNGLETIDEGTVIFNGDIISGLGVDLDSVRRHIGIVFQSYNLFPHMTVLENVTLGPRHVLHRGKSESNRAGLAMLERVGLESQAASYPDRLSGGQQQRVAIARALAMDPRVILLDEITSALDPELVGEVLALVRALANDGMTMIIATHEMAFAKEIATNICFLDAGRICEEGNPGQIFGSPTQERTRLFLRRVLDGNRL